MGAWDTDAFGNDTACDWAYSLEGSGDLSLVESTIDRVLATGSDYLEAPEAEEALAAAEVIARLQGNWGIRNVYSEPVDTWVERTQLKPSPNLVRKAHAIIDRIRKFVHLSCWSFGKIVKKSRHGYSPSLISNRE